MAIAPSDMLLFVAVVRAGGFARAARPLGISRQTVSERIGALESRLGVRLLERTTRRLRPTDAGASYFERCAAIAAQIEEANIDVQRGQAEPVGLLRVSAPVLYGRRFLAPVVADYLRRFPKTRVDVVLADRRVNLIEEGIDLAIRIGPLDDSSLTARKLGDASVFYVASPAYLKAHGTPTPRSLRSARCISITAAETWTVGGVSSRIEPVLVVNDLEIACDAAIAGVGIARVPGLVCQQAVLDGRLRVLFPLEPAHVRPASLVFPSRRFLPAKVRLFIEALEALVAPMALLAAARPPALREKGSRSARSAR